MSIFVYILRLATFSMLFWFFFLILLLRMDVLILCKSSTDFRGMRSVAFCALAVVMKISISVMYSVFYARAFPPHALGLSKALFNTYYFDKATFGLICQLLIVCYLFMGFWLFWLHMHHGGKGWKYLKKKNATNSKHWALFISSHEKYPRRQKKVLLYGPPKVKIWRRNLKQKLINQKDKQIEIHLSKHGKMQ